MRYALAALLGALLCAPVCRIWVRFAGRTCLPGLLAAMFLVPGNLAVAHDNYPPECCGGGPSGDCEPVFGEAVRGGYRFLVRSPQSGAVVEFIVKEEATRRSHNGQYHACWPKYAPEPRCFFAPVAGT
jgi:hypothetical protein